MENNRDKCRLGDKVYSSGEVVCNEELCYVCRAGEWDFKLSNFIGVGL